MEKNADIGSLRDVLKQFYHVLESRLRVDGELRLVFCQNNIGLCMKFGLHACLHLFVYLYLYLGHHA